MPHDDLALDTLAVHAGLPGRIEGAVSFPVFHSSTFAARDAEDDEVRYTRLSNTPNQLHLAAKLAALTGAEDALVTASGMAATSAVLTSLLAHGDHALFQADVYGGTRAFATEELPRAGVATSFVPMDAPERWAAALRPTTRVLWVESLTNPRVKVTDLVAAIAFARAHGLVTVVDNTFASPVNLRPLALGADVEIHSASKYLGGHSDLVAGVVAGSRERVAAARERLVRWGGNVAPAVCFLLERGLKTLALRVARQNENARFLASRLASHPDVARVDYPGVGPEPLPPAMASVLRGFGGVFAFELAGGAAAAERFLSRLRLLTAAPSLGGVESLVSRPTLTSHASLTAEERAALGIGDGMVRVSCGIEAADDLLADLLGALRTG
ncbi:MAG: PLP-dependent transferase [Deltaproteobacteria bacterium]|nr:MAG: PLP-dependent transferase [Deltaproteobacteria bacterium]